MLSDMPTAMQSSTKPPNAPRANAVGKYPSKRSITELISGTPGIKNKTEVAIVFSGDCPM